MDTQRGQSVQPSQPSQLMNGTCDITTSQLIAGASSTSTVVTNTASTTPSTGRKRTLKRTLSLDCIISATGSDSQSNSTQWKKAKRGRPCGSSTTDNAAKDKGKNKKSKKDKTSDTDSVPLDLSSPTKAKSISIDTQTDSFDPITSNSTLQSIQSSHEDQSSHVDPSSSLQPVGLDSLSQSKSLLNLVQKCTEAMLIPMSNDVYGLQADMHQLQAAMRELTAKVNELLLFNAANVVPVNGAALNTNPSTSAVPVNQISMAVGPASTADVSAPVNNHPVSYADVTGRHRNQTSHVDAQPTDRRSTVAAVYLDQHEQNRRARNVIITGLKTSHNTSDNDTVAALLRIEFRMRPEVKQVRRLGRSDASDRIRPVLVTLERQEDAAYLVNNARLLRESQDEYVSNSVFLNADLTRAQAQAAYEIRCRRRAWRHRSDNGRVFVNSRAVTNSDLGAAAESAAAAAASTDAVNMSSISSVTSSPISAPAVQSRLYYTAQAPVSAPNSIGPSGPSVPLAGVNVHASTFTPTGLPSAASSGSSSSTSAVGQPGLLQSAPSFLGATGSLPVSSSSTAAATSSQSSTH